MKRLIPWIVLIIVLSPLALAVQDKFVYSDSPFLSPSLGSVEVQHILSEDFNASEPDYLFVLVNGTYNSSLNQVRDAMKYLNDAQLITPYEYLGNLTENYNKSVEPLVSSLYKRVYPLHEIYLNLTVVRNETVKNLTAFLYVLNVTYGVPLNRTVLPSKGYYEFVGVYENLSRVMPSLEAARNASLKVFGNPFVLLFSFDNYSNSTLVAYTLEHFSNYAYLVNALYHVNATELELEDPYAYAYNEVKEQVPPPPISLSNFHRSDTWLFIVKVPDNESLFNVVDFTRSVNGTVTGHLAIYAESMVETETDLRLVDIATVVILGVLLVVLLRALYPILSLLMSAVLALEVAYGTLYLLTFFGYKVYYISGLVVPPIVFGITVDYSVLFLYRYYEELNKGSPEPLNRAFSNVRNAVIFSGLTIVVGFVSFVLTPSDLLKNIGVALIVSALSSLIPPLTFMRDALKSASMKLLKFPRKDIPKVEDIRQELLRKVSNWSVRHRGLVLVVYLLLGLLALYHVSHSHTNVYISEIVNPDSKVVKGLNELDSFYNYSVDYLIVKGNPNDSYASIQNISKSLIDRGALVYGPASIGKYVLSNETYLTNYYYSHNYTLLEVYIPYPVFSDGAINFTKSLYKYGLIGGENAQRIDIVDQATHDYIAITLPLTVLFLLVYLMVTLRSVFMSLRLVLTLAVSAVIGLSLTYLTFGNLYWLTPLVIFAIMFSLGIDYDMFIIVRSLEEGGSPVQRILKAIEVTGMAVTSSGLILSGAFFSLMVSQMRFLQEIGFGVAITIAIDTFLVRPIVVPAIIAVAERFAWWPRKLGEASRSQ